MVPYNLWFRDNLYKISNNFENHQNIRIRYFGDIMLTPLVSRDDPHMNKIKNFLNMLSVYQPFYPETFYFVWEILKQEYLETESKKFLYMGKGRMARNNGSNNILP